MQFAAVLGLHIVDKSAPSRASLRLERFNLAILSRSAGWRLQPVAAAVIAAAPGRVFDVWANFVCAGRTLVVRLALTAGSPLPSGWCDWPSC
jgi:hypothetical protein